MKILKSCTPIILCLLILFGCHRGPDLLRDTEGITYKTKVYNGKHWMIENLRVKKDRNNQAVTYYFPDNDPNNEDTYGLLYDYETACKICPNGWRLPTNDEWTALFEIHQTDPAYHFKDDNYWADETNTNSTGFSIRPTGSGNNGEHPNQFGSKIYFWTADHSDEFAWTFIIEKGKKTIRKAEQHLVYGFGVRCVKVGE